MRCSISRSPAGCRASTGWRQRARGPPRLREGERNRRTSAAAASERISVSVPRTAAEPGRLPGQSAPRTGPHSHTATTTYTHQIIVGNHAAWGFILRPCITQEGWGPATKAEGESTRITKLELFLKPDSPILLRRRRGGQGDSPAPWNRRTWERNRNGTWSPHCECELRKLK